MSTVDQYAVVGNPIAHSKSPEIHLLFGRQTKQKIGYERIEAPIDGFEEKALSLRDAGYRGLNVTVPFKLDAAKLANELTPRARLAGAVNTLKFDGDTILGDNTDGIGFVRDVTERLGFGFGDCAVLVLGAGGAVRGLLGSLLDASPRWLAVANRSHQRAEELAEEFGVEAIHFDEIPGGALRPDHQRHDDRTATTRRRPSIPRPSTTACWRMTSSTRPIPRPFMQLAKAGGAKQVTDGLGMLIEQAAESFLLWRGVRPETQSVYRDLRALLSREAHETAGAR